MAINVLPENIANQIAAGEVVNRPGSVVKELIENAIDANSSQITLVIQDAGRTLIEVIDNGCGMDENDARKCFLPHATSKIKTENDLRNLTTMGFRGEALASIAAISQVELKTKKEDSDLAEEVLIEGGEIKSISKTTSSKGTDIKVKNIFFNVPARRNFLKSDNIELSHINDAFIRIVLINPNVSFTYMRDGHTIYKLEKATFRKRIVDIFGNQFNKNILEIKEKLDLVEINGFISTINLTKKGKGYQYFFVNNRYMKNSYFANAVERAYCSLIPPKNYPCFFIHLKVNPKDIDVNIHPTKTEVKFIDDKIIYSILNAVVRKVLGQNTLSNALSFEKSPISFPNPDKNYIASNSMFNYSNSFNPFAKQNSNPSLDFSSTVNKVKVQTEISFNDENIITNSPNNLADNRAKYPFQFLNRYIIYQTTNYILLINQFNASKKVIYEFLNGKISMILQAEKLLLPYIHKFSTLEIISLQARISLLEKIGFEFTINEDNSVNFTSMPKNMTISFAINLVNDLISEDINENDKNLLIADRLAIKEGKILSQNEIQSLINQLLQLENPEFLPMNERVFLRIDNEFLSKFFF
ncbi:MAG: DNA mismatch repair endonuclease MutL [Bacteroidales bacterium]